MNNNRRRVNVKYIPHGINTDTFFPIDEEHEQWGMVQDMKKNIFGRVDTDFILFYNSRNIRRKMTSDIIVAFRNFMKERSKEEREKCFLLLHTTPIDENGTDLPAVINEIMPDEYRDNVVISGEKVQAMHLNLMYNLADVTILISSNEGFGLGTAESLATGTPIIVNVTGGLQDQCGFMLDGEYLTADDYLEIGSLHRWRKWKNNDRLTHGEWVKPIWPRTVSLVGSPPTPYIYDDRVDAKDITDAITYWYLMDVEARKERGRKGFHWLKNEGGLNVDNMTGLFKEHITDDLKQFIPRKRFEVIQL